MLTDPLCGNLVYVSGALLLFINLALVAMVLVAGLGAIETDGGPEIDENGWYGQFSVCICFTCLLWTLHGIFFAYWLRKRNLAAHEAEAEAACDKNKNDNNLGQIPYVHWGGGSDQANHSWTVTTGSDQPSKPHYDHDK